MKEKKVWPKKECKKCKKTFQPWNNIQSFCKNPCVGKKQLTIAEINANWALRTEEDRKKQYKNCKANFHLGQMRVI